MENKKMQEIMSTKSVRDSPSMICNPQIRYSTPKKLVCKSSTAAYTPRKSPRLIEKANRLSNTVSKMVLDFESHVEEPRYPTEASVMDVDSLGQNFWNLASEKADNVEEAFGALKEPILHLENFEEDDCHPDDQPWSQPLMYSEGEDDRDCDEFLQYFCMKNRGADEDNEEEEEGNVSNLTNNQVLDSDNGETENFSNIPRSNVGVEPLLTANDFDEFFAADIVDNELFSESDHDKKIVSDKIEVGLQFLDKTDFQKHLRKFCVSNRIVCKFQKSDNVRIKAVCQGFGPPVMCPWFVSARKIPGEPTWSIRKCNLQHTCVGDPYGRNSSANHEFVADHLLEKIMKSHSKIIPKPSEIIDEFWTSHNTLIPYHVAWKARNKVLEKINGSYDESFKLIPSLCEMITRTNPRSIATYTYGSKDKTFESVTIAFDASMRAFAHGCRNVVGLDGCHLKGKYGGCLLSATALDGQNGLVPLGIMICKNECAENWYLFLKHLKPRLEEHPVQPINFISDRQKGLRDAVHKLFPASPHRFCFRHMYRNFKTHFKGSKLHAMFWNAAKAYKAKHFQVHMDSMSVENVKAFEYLMGEEPKTWCRAFFDKSSCCEHLSNNFSESFNNMIAKIREKPLCKLVLMYGQLVMGLFYKRRTACIGWSNGDLVPSAKKLVKVMFKKIGEYKVQGAVAGKLYEVTSIHNSIFVVDLDKQTCSCVQWQLRGFPCQHAVCALQQIRPNWIEYCAKYYSVDNYKITYASEMLPLEGPDDWEEPTTTILPPLLIRKQGRPRKNRRKAYDETLHEKKSRCCSKCKQPGHNKTTCGGGQIGSNSKKKRDRSQVDC